MLKAKQKLLKWPEVRAGGETVVQDYGVETLNRDRQPLEKKSDVSFFLNLGGDPTTQLSEETNG